MLSHLTRVIPRFLLFVVLATALSANSHFVVYTIGLGASFRSSDDQLISLRKGSFIPKKQNIFVRPESGVETIVKGAWVRFGAGTSFFYTDEQLELFSGAILVNLTESKSKMFVAGPEAQVGFSGSGALMINIEPNGGLKIVGLFGYPQLITGNNIKTKLLPGNVLFLMPGSFVFSKKVDVVLPKLIESTFLISGFPNSEQFMKQLKNASSAQEKNLLNTYRATVGSAKESNNFEIIRDPRGL